MSILGNDSSAGKKPTTPVIGTATDGGTGTTVSVPFTPSTYIGKGTITYTALSTPGSISATSSGTPITVTGLTSGTAYTFTVTGNTNYGVASDASAASNSVTPLVPTVFESIATTYLSAGNQSTVQFSSIPQTYTHLQIRGVSKNTNTNASYSDLLVRFNGDTVTNFMAHSFSGNGSSGFSGFSGTQAHIQIGNTLPRSSASEANMFGTFIIDIMDYTNTNKFKTTNTFSGSSKNTLGSQVHLMSGLWRSTSAINTILLFSDSNDLARYSHFALYGIKVS